jgi:hypothetical protein
METNRSILQLMLQAYDLGQRIWPDYRSEFSRQDFTQPQLFACLVVREGLKLSYRRAEAEQDRGQRRTSDIYQIFGHSSRYWPPGQVQKGRAWIGCLCRKMEEAGSRVRDRGPLAGEVGTASDGDFH